MRGQILPDSVAIEGLEVVVRTHETIPAQRLEGEALRRLNVLSVADAVRYFAGVQVKDYGGVGGLKTVNVRSLGSTHTGVVYDGVAIGNAQNGTVDLGRFSLTNMEAVALYNGQRSARGQSARDFSSAAALYLTSRRPTENSLRVSLKGGSFATINPAVVWEQRLGARVTTSVSAEYLYTSGRYKFRYKKADGYDTTAYRRNGDVQALRAEAGVYGAKWDAKAYYYRSERGYPGAVVREEPGKFRHEDRQWDDNLFVQGSWSEQWAKYAVRIRGKYAYDVLHYRSDPRLDVSTMWVDNTYKQHEGYVSVAHDVTLTRWWNAGLATDVQYNALDANVRQFTYPRRFQSLNALSTSIHLKKFDAQLALLHTFCERNYFTPSVSLSYNAIKGLDLRAFYKKIVRLPTLNDLYYTVVGQSALEPERSTQYNLGASYKWRWLEASVDGYFNEVRNKIVALPSDNQFRWTMLNLGRVEILGVDFSVAGNAKINTWELHGGVNYTYQDACDVTEKSDPWYGGQIPYIPRHSGSVILGAQWRGWSLDYSFVYTGERYASRANTPENYVRPWYTHDVALSKTLKKWRFTVEINNLLNQQYEVVDGYPMPGTNVFLKVSFAL